MSAIIRTSRDAVTDNAGDPLAYVSASRLKSFLSCRLKFYYEKVLGLKPPASHNLQIGKAVHAGLQFFHKAVWRGEDAAVEAVAGEYARQYGELEQQDPVDYEGLPREECLASGERVLRAYLASDLARDPRGIMGVEVALRSEDAGLPLPLVGIVDLVREGVVPVDFKTAGSTPTPSTEAWLHESQLVAYNILLRDATGEQPGPGELVHLVKLKTPKVIYQQLPPVEQRHLDRFRALVNVYVAGVKNEEYYPAPGLQCSWCSFRGSCAKWTGGRQQEELKKAA